MTAQYRTTVSAVFWTDTPEDAQEIADALKGEVPDDDRTSTLVTVEYVADGKPELPPAEE